MRHLLAGFARDGKSVAVITQRIPGSRLPKREDIDGIDVRRVGSARLFTVQPKLAQVAFFGVALMTVVALRPRVLVSLQMGSASVAASLGARLFRVRHIVRLTGGGTATSRSEPIARAKSPVGRAVVRLLSTRRTTLVAPAQHLLDDFSEVFPRFKGRKIRIINGVRPVAAVDAPISEVVWYARSGSEKTSAAFVEVAERLPDVAFTVMGAAMPHQAPDNVTFLGWRDDPEAVLAQHRVLLNTSLVEGMPNTVLQAVAGGCRVVGLDNAGMREVREMFPDVVRVVPPGDSEGLAQAVREALSVRPEGRPRVPTIDDVEQRWLGLLEESEKNGHMSERRKSVGSILWWLVYAALASRLPSWSKRAKRFRVFCARRFCADVHPSANINKGARLGWATVIGAHGGVGEGSILSGSVTIGPHVTMGPGCRFITGDHPVPPDGGSFRDMKSVHKPIRVEEDAFLGAGVMILPGVTIGRGAAVGAGAVVAKDVAPGATVVGNPAREIRRREV